MSSNICFTLFIVIVATICSLSHAYDPDPLQDFCVGVDETTPSVFVNGQICKDPATVTADDFLFTGLNIPGNITSPIGSRLTPVFVGEMPGLNTLGISMVRIDFAPGGLNAPHSHPHASEILVVLEGTLYTGFIGSNPLTTLGRNRLYTRTLNAGDAFVYPKGLIHFQYNVGQTNAVAYAFLGSQNPGVVTIGNSMFGAVPPINPDMLARAFQLDRDVIIQAQARNWTENV